MLETLSFESLNWISAHAILTVMFRRLLKMAIATSNFMNEVYNDEFAPVFSVLVLKEVITPVRNFYRKLESEKQN